ncbi:baseplate J/gp47 family protein [Acinetobacter sp. VNK23]|uniref:baseplate J/gp47 family protein n=1 Tax=Acinetobacter thutiue TaxID=2998078 RepID=UPI0025756E13|nr:baseplate J/gp47 family protein [Acinetobacter thutiue]MDM1022071.1 baseplate J/gp47 family protein [Acinetobacter thutiue]
MSIDFSQLIKPQIIDEPNFESLLTSRKQALIDCFDDTDKKAEIEATLQRESEPLTKLLEESVYRELILRKSINNAALSVLLAFAERSDLDAVVANYGITRLLITPANQYGDAVYESDEALRYRASLVFDSLSVAGPTSAYEYHALSADGRVADAKASSPAPAEALVTILQRDSINGEASPDLVSLVTGYLSDETRRPVADRLMVQSVTAIDFELVATIFTNNFPEADPLIQAAERAVQAYLQESRRIGRTIYLSKIFNLLHVPGVVHVEIESPLTDVSISDMQVANCTNILINAGAV